MNALPEASSRRSRALPLLVAVVVLSGCAGENLFQNLVALGGASPTVSITAPNEGFTMAQGASVQITAETNTPNGLTIAEFKGVYVDTGTEAFVPQTQSFQNVPFASLSQVLAAAAVQTPGDVYIVVSVTDGQGEAAADTVKIILN